MSRLKSHDQAGTAPAYIRFKLNGVRRLVRRLYEAERDSLAGLEPSIETDTLQDQAEDRHRTAQLQIDSLETAIMMRYSA